MLKHVRADFLYLTDMSVPPRSDILSLEAEIFLPAHVPRFINTLLPGLRTLKYDWNENSRIDELWGAEKCYAHLETLVIDLDEHWRFLVPYHPDEPKRTARLVKEHLLAINVAALPSLRRMTLKHSAALDNSSPLAELLLSSTEHIRNTGIIVQI